MINMDKESSIDALRSVDLHLTDDQWPPAAENYDRRIVRAVVFVPEREKFAFVRLKRHDIFGDGEFLETSGGGIEEAEEEVTALSRELKEELGYHVAVITKIGVVTDYYNLIGRRNINNYYLVRKFGDVPKELTTTEKLFGLHPVFLSLEEALKEYRERSHSKLGHLIAEREIPIVSKVKSILEYLL